MLARGLLSFCLAVHRERGALTSWVVTGRGVGNHFQAGLRHLGIRATLTRGLHGYLWPHRFVVFRCLPAAAPLPPGPPTARFDVWRRERLARWRRTQAGLPLEFFQDEIHGVEECAVAEVDGAPAALIWIYHPADRSRFFHLAPGHAELNYGYVLAPYRRRGLFERLLAFACQHLGRRQYRAVWAAVHESNVPSRRAFSAAGFKEVGTLRHFLLFRPRLATVGAA